MKWKTLQHNGIIFPPDYEPKGFTVKIKGQPVKLDADQEEMIYQWAKKKDTPYVKDAVFQKNFVADFAATFGGKFKGLSISDIDFFRGIQASRQGKELKGTDDKGGKKSQLPRKERSFAKK